MTPPIRTLDPIARRFDLAANMLPERVALSGPEGVMTYAELRDRAARMASSLTAHGIGPGDIVAVAMRPTNALIETIVAINRCGAAYLPLDVAHPAERLRATLVAAAPRFLITDDTEAVRAPDGVEAAIQSSLQSDSSAAPVVRSLDDPAYVIFTSGSTGTPKGVVVTQKNLARLFTATDTLFDFDADDCWSLFHSIAFDFSVWEMWGALLHGARLVIVPRDVARTADRFHDLISREGVTVLSQTPSSFRAFDMADDLAQRPDTTLRYVVLGGERLDPRSLAAWFDAHGGSHPQLINMYGITETTVHVTFRRMEPGDVSSDGASFIGDPLPDLRLDLLDAVGAPVQDGATGEIWVSGPGVAAGYLNQPELTCERFRADPQTGALRYRSGDLARRTASGELEYLGRNDDQIQLRGFRIELGEIEAALRTLGGVRDAAVCFVEGPDGGGRLVAHVVLSEDSVIDPDTLCPQLSVCLPPYMIPSVCRPIQALPRTANDKLDRAALPTIDAAPAGTGRIEAGDFVEGSVEGIFSDVLGPGRRNRSDALIWLGGDSIHAMRIAQLCGQRLAASISVAEILQHGSIESVAALVQAHPAGVPGPRIDRTRPLLLSPQQRALWLELAIRDAPAAYNERVALHVDARLDEDRLRTALGVVAHGHDALHARILSPEGIPYWSFEVDPEAIELSVIETAAPDLAHLRLVADTPFDLKTGPLWRVELQLHEHASTLMVVAHHLVFDLNAAELILHALSQAYETPERALSSGSTDLAEVVAQETLRLSADRQELERFWIGEVSTTKTVSVDLPPALEPVAPSEANDAIVATHRLDADTAAQFREFARQHDATAFHAYLASVAVLLRALSGRDDIVLATPASLRDGPGRDSVVGYLLAPALIGVALKPEAEFGGLLEDVAATWRRVHRHARLPLDEVLRATAPHGEKGRPNVYFAYHEGVAADVNLGGAATQEIDVAPGTAKIPLFVEVRKEAAGVLLRIEARRGDLGTIIPGVLVQALGTLVRSAVRASRSTVRELDAAAFRTAMPPRTWEGSDATPAGEKTISDLFQRMVREHGASVAVIDEERSLTYRELDEYARRLAAVLRAKGARAGDRIPLLVPRSHTLIAWMLAVLDLGAVYVPLDPTYPPERLRRMLEGLGCSVGVLAPETPPPDETIRWISASTAGSPSTEGPDGGRCADDAAYIMFTSGSTGRPKAVEVPHRAVARLVRDQAFCRMGPGETWLHMASASFDASTLEVWAPLLNGGRCVVLREGLTKPDRLRETVEQHGVTSAWITASLFNTLISEAPDCLAGFSQILTGGEALSPSHMRRALEQLPDTTLINGYGPTENTTFTCCHVLTLGEGRARASVPIGQPLAGTTVYVLGRDGRRVPVGFPGELVTGGEGVALGYANDPALTAERFAPDPFTGKPDAMMYRTGDRVRWRPEGVLEFLGRFDDQVKIRGHRVEPGEVVALLEEHEGVRNAAVLVEGEGTETAHLVAFVVPAGSSSAASLAERLHQYAVSELPPYLRPREFVTLDEIPLTSAGKVDRRALTRIGGAPGGHGTAPQSELEGVIAHLFAELLGTTVEDRHANFLALGGHSLLTLQLSIRIQRDLNVDISLHDLLSDPTVRGVALTVEVARVTEAPPPRVQHQPRDGPVPLSPQQRALWLELKMRGQGCAYHVPVAIDAQSPLDETRLRHALRQLFERHEALRCRLLEIDGEPHLAFDATWEAHQFEVIDFAKATEETELECIQQEFQLSKGPLWRAQLRRHEAGTCTLLLVFHHIVFDAGSLQALLSDLAQAYNHPGTLRTPPAYNLADLCLNECSRLNEDRERLEEFWVERLGDLTSLTPALPPPRSSVLPDEKGGVTRASLVLPSTLITLLRGRAREWGVSPFQVFMATFLALLRRYGGDDDVVVGTPVSLRDRAASQGVIGYALGIVAFPLHLEGDESFRDMVVRAGREWREVHAHARLPLDLTLRAVSGARPGGTAPPGVFLTYRQTPLVPRLDEARARLRYVAVPDAKFNLLLDIVDDPDGTSFHLEADRGAFDPLLVNSVLRHMETMLSSALARPDRPLDSILPLNTTERTAVLRSAHAETSLPEPWPFVPDTIAHVARVSPDRVALRDANDKEVSYARLLAAADRLARRLLDLGIGTEDVVPVVLRRSPALVVTWLGIMRAGAAYAAIDPAHPPVRRQAMIDDCSARVVICEPDLADAVRDIEHVWAPTAPPPDRAWVPIEEVDSSPDNLAYVMFTSGSTGRPKGVEIEHHALSHAVAWEHKELGIRESDHSSLISGVGFDGSVWETWATLAAGATLHLPSDDIRTHPTKLRDWIIERDLTIAYAPTPIVEALLDLDWPDDIRLRTLQVGGERLRRRPPADLPFKLLNVYGPTEFTVWATAAAVHPDGPGLPSIGYALSDCSAYVLDHRRELCCEGFIGELALAGPQIARGYRGLPARTAEAFPTVEFEAGLPERIYLTGDLVRRGQDGALDFIGRRDGQIKLRGVRIELGEIEQVVQSHRSVGQCAVVLRGSTEAPVLVAFLEPTARGTAPDSVALSQLAAATLPAVMVPARWVVLDALPRTASGKINRRALPDDAASFSGVPSRAPENETEQRVLEIWRRVFANPNALLDDGFFASGGHSLLAVHLAAQLRRDLGVDISLHEMLADPTVGGIARTARDALGIESQPPPIEARSGNGAAPLSYSQQRLWFIEQFGDDVGPAPVTACIRIRGDLDLAALAESTQETVRRHEILRTVYEDSGGLPCQRVLPLDLPPLERTPVRHEGLSDYRIFAAREVQRLTERPFDLSRDIPIRFSLLQTSGSEHVLIIWVHHIAADAWSMQVLLEELGDQYAARHSGGAPAHSAPPVQYGDFSAWQRNWPPEQAIQEGLTYWRERLARAPASTEFPIDFPRPPVRAGRGAEASLRVPARLAQSLRDLSQANGVSLFMTMLAGFQALIYRHTRQDDVIVGTPIATRGQPGLESAIGIYLNSLVIRSDFSGGPSFMEALARVQTTVLGAFEHKSVPFERLVRELHPERRRNQSPLYQILFNMYQGPASSLDLQGLDVEFFDVGTKHAQHDLTLYVVGAGDELTLHAVYDTDLYTAMHIEEILNQYLGLLKQVSSSPEMSIDAISLMTPRALQVLEDPTAHLHTPDHAPVASMFEQAARANPDRIAVTQESDSLTYGQLSMWTEEIADSLSHDLPPNSAIAVSGPRSFGLIAAALAVLRSPHVLLLIDPEVPNNRKAQMLHQANAQRLVWVGTQTPDDLPAWTAPADPLEVLRVDPHGEAPEREAAARSLSRTCIASGPTPDDPAYIVFTSGSTGRPKGVRGTHKGLSQFLAWQRETFQVGTGHRVAQLTSLSFDVVLRDFFLPLTAGATLCLPPPRFDPTSPAVVDWIRTERVTHLHTVPALSRAWLRDDAPASVENDLAFVFFAGEPLLEGDVNRWRMSFGPACGIVNLYGPTETSLAKCFHVVPDPPTPGVQPIGRALPQTTVCLLGPSYTRCGLGEMGEIFLRTPFRTLGYLESSEAGGAFVQSPFSSEVDDLLYRTGDLGRFRMDGVLEILGRIDDQVKVNGVRIELGEVESVLREHPSVSACAAARREGEAGQSVLHAWVVSASNAPIEASELRRHLAQRLPGAMLPTAFIRVSELPLLPSGKIDRLSLPAPGEADLEGGAEYVAARGRLEADLVPVWERVLDRSPIGMHDDFFSLGGHSLLAVRLVDRISSTLPYAPALVDLFEAPTIARLALRLALKRDAQEPHGPVSFNTNGSLRPLFALPGMGGVAGFTFRKLAQALGAQQPVYGLELLGIDGKSEPHRTLRDMAAYQVETMRSLQASGPYALVGYSFGGRLALEIALQLRAHGEEIDLLAMIDSSAPGYPKIAPLHTRLALHIEQVATRGWSGGTNYILQRLQRAAKRVGEGFRRSAPRPKVAQEDSLEERLAALDRLTRLAALAYRPDPYEGDMTLFRSSVRPDWLGASHQDPENGWGEFVSGNIDVRSVPGKHLQIFDEPNFAHLVRGLRSCLDSRAESNR